MSEQGDEGMARYVAATDGPWAPAVDTILKNLTRAEYLLIQEVVAAAYRRGQSFPADQRLPADFVLVRDTLIEALANPELTSPWLRKLAQGGRS